MPYFKCRFLLVDTGQSGAAERKVCHFCHRHDIHLISPTFLNFYREIAFLQDSLMGNGNRPGMRDLLNSFIRAKTSTPN